VIAIVTTPKLSEAEGRIQDGKSRGGFVPPLRNYGDASAIIAV
jgi:hypothetical protein